MIRIHIRIRLNKHIKKIFTGTLTYQGLFANSQIGAVFRNSSYHLYDLLIQKMK